ILTFTGKSMSSTKIVIGCLAAGNCALVQLPRLQAVGTSTNGASTLCGKTVALGYLTLYHGSVVVFARMSHDRADEGGSCNSRGERGQVDHFYGTRRISV